MYHPGNCDFFKTGIQNIYIYIYTFNIHKTNTINRTSIFWWRQIWSYTFIGWWNFRGTAMMSCAQSLWSPTATCPLAFAKQMLAPGFRTTFFYVWQMGLTFPEAFSLSGYFLKGKRLMKLQNLGVSLDIFGDTATFVSVHSEWFGIIKSAIEQCLPTLVAGWFLRGLYGYTNQDVLGDDHNPWAIPINQPRIGRRGRFAGCGYKPW